MSWCAFLCALTARRVAPQTQINADKTIEIISNRELIEDLRRGSKDAEGEIVSLDSLKNELGF